MVEPDSGVRTALAETLLLAGYAVTPVATTDAARAAYTGSPFPFVVHRASPPDARGLALCQWIRAQPAGSETSVIVLSDRSDAAALGAMLEAGADDFVVSPNQEPILLAALAMATRKRQREQRWREREERRFRRLLDATPDGILAVDADGRIAHANRQARRLFGLDDHPTTDLMLRNLVDIPSACGDTGGHPCVADVGSLVSARRGDGSVFPAEVRLSRIATGGEAMTIASVRDLSEQNRQEAKRRSDEQRLRMALAAADMGTWDWDLVSGELRWSSETERLVGIETGGRYTIEDFERTLHPDDLEPTRARIRAVLESGGEYSSEYRVVLADGEIQWCHAVGRLERDAAGTPLSLRGIAMDITRRKQDELALREGEARFRAAFEQAGIGMAVVGLDGRWLRVNASLLAMLGYERDELLALPGFQAITHPDDLEPNLALIRRLNVGEIDGYQLEKRYRCKDGRYLWGLLSVALVHDGEGQPVYVVAQIQDISAGKQAQAALQEAHAELARVIGSVSDCLYSAELTADGTYAYRYFSPAALRVLGRPAEAFMADAEQWPRCVHPDDLPAVHRSFARVREGLTGDHLIELRVVWPDGTTRWIQDRALITPSDGGGAWLDGVLTDITERKSFESELAHRAQHDALTDLPNRPLFLERLTAALASRKRRGELTAVLFLDLDHFKTINDGLGHEAGDDVLRAVAGRLHRELRDGDTLARFGGDEFVVLLERVRSADEAAATARRLIEAMSAPTTVQGRELYLGASIGIALAGPRETDPSVVLRNADAALYRAKAAGRNRSAVFDPDMTLEALARLELEADLRRTLEDGSGLLLHYQPIFAVDDGRLTGCEALVRWVYPHGGVIGPDVFIPLAEETGLIVPLGTWVLDEACRQLCAWRRLAGAGEMTVSVNLSPRHFREPGLVEQIAALLAAHGLAPRDLTLEVTEGVMIDDQARETLARLKALGVGLAIDDFGTGYSSLAYLGSLDADVLKIDRRFVAGLTAGGHDPAIVRAILALGESLGMTVTAEGVETAEQHAALRRLGCHRAQGYLLGRPMPADGFAAAFLDPFATTEPAPAIVPDRASELVGFASTSPNPRPLSAVSTAR